MQIILVRFVSRYDFVFRPEKQIFER